MIAASKMEIVKSVLKKGAYTDNYNSNFRTVHEYIQVGDKMKRIHNQIGLPLKGTYTNVKTDKDILTKPNKFGENHHYTFLGLQWDLVENTILPNIYFKLEKKKKGSQGLKILMEMSAEDFAQQSFIWGIMRRVISWITAQAYSRLGAMLSTVIMNLKICVSRACETR